MFAGTLTFEKEVMWEYEITNKRNESTRIRKVCSSCQFFLAKQVYFRLASRISKFRLNTRNRKVSKELEKRTTGRNPYFLVFGQVAVYGIKMEVETHRILAARTGNRIEDLNTLLIAIDAQEEVLPVQAQGN